LALRVVALTPSLMDGSGMNRIKL